MKISIIIPVYNVAPYIERCLLSVLNQTYKDIEIIIVDDCGTDISMEIVNKVIKIHSAAYKVKVIHHQKNRGLSAARNTGVDAAIGEYVYFLDSDDEITLDCIEILSKQASEFKTDFVIGGYESVGGDGVIGSILDMPIQNIFSNQEILSLFKKGVWYEMAWNKLVNRNFLSKRKLYFREDIIHEDNLWSFMLACESSSMSIVPIVTYKYYLRGNSIVNSINKKSYESKIRIIEYKCNYIKKNPHLFNNKVVYDLYESGKTMTFLCLLKSSYYSRQKLFEIYKKIRKEVYINPIVSFFKFELNIKKCVRNLHYLFFPLIGFYYYVFLLNRLKK